MKNLRLSILLAILFPLFSHGATTSPSSELGWSALPHGRPFGILLSDPRDLKLGLRGNNKSEIEADVGGYRSLAGWRGENGTEFHTGIEGGAYFQMRKAGSNFPLHSSDGLIGIYAEAAREAWALQFRYTHISAHLSDGLTSVRDRILYTREYIALRLARQIDWVRVYAGYQVLVHTKPELPRHMLQLGGYAILPMHWGIVHPYLGADLRVRGAEEGTTYQLGAGVALVSEQGTPPVRIAAHYLKGHDLRGQFYNEKTEKWIFGLDLDL